MSCEGVGISGRKVVYVGGASSVFLFLGVSGNEPPTSAYATFMVRNGHLGLAFDADVDEASIFRGILSDGYGGGGLDVTLLWTSTSATSGNCDWEVSFERLADGGTDIDADSFASAKAVTAACPGTSGALKYSTISFSNSEIDGLLAGEMFRLKVNRDANDATNDTMTGDAELYGIIISEP